MPYGVSSLDKEEGPGAVEERGDRAPILQKGEDPTTPPMTPGNAGDLPELNQGEESEDLLFAMPPEGDKPSGMAQNELTPAETEPQPPLEPDTPEVITRPPNGDDEQQPSEPEPCETSTQPSSPAASQDAEGVDNYTIPPLQ